MSNSCQTILVKESLFSLGLSHNEKVFLCTYPNEIIFGKISNALVFLDQPFKILTSELKDFYSAIIEILKFLTSDLREIEVNVLGFVIKGISINKQNDIKEKQVIFQNNVYFLTFNCAQFNTLLKALKFSLIFSLCLKSDETKFLQFVVANFSDSEISQMKEDNVFIKAYEKYQLITQHVLCCPGQCSFLEYFSYVIFYNEFLCILSKLQKLPLN